MSLNCEMLVFSDVEHLQQIYTGFAILHRKGFLKLRQKILQDVFEKKETGWTDYRYFNTKVILNSKIRICYDVHDWNWIDEQILSEVDFYFKRSYDECCISQLKEREKVFPLGLNYQVASSERDFFKLERAVFHKGKDKIKSILKGTRLDRFFIGHGETERLDNLEAHPDFDLEPKVLFMTRAWDVNMVEDKKQKDFIQALNDSRAECVRILRREFGSRFYGGLACDDYAKKYYKDCLISDPSLSKKKNYLRLLKEFPICVTTTGLNKSNGWKLGEYVALSKAIVTEPLHFQVPGNFEREKNYLEFTTPNELVNAVHQLFEDKALRCSMMMNNYRYYQAYVRPDSLVLNTLSVVFENLRNSASRFDFVSCC